MNPINGLAALKKPFTWKFSRYPKFQKKIKLNFNEKENGTVGKDWDKEAGCHTTPAFRWNFDEKKYVETEEDVNDLAVKEDGDPDYSTVNEAVSSANSDGPVYENTTTRRECEPVYENFVSFGSEEEEEHIYDYVSHSYSNLQHCSLVSSREPCPLNVFLSLVEGEGNTISPDPNIYEVPPGAILNSEFFSEDCTPPRNISPPNEFQDKLTWNRFQLVKNNLTDENSLYSLPIEVIYSTVVKPRRKKLRPGIEAVLNPMSNMKDAVDCKNKIDPEDKCVTLESEVPQMAEQKIVSNTDISTGFNENAAIQRISNDLQTSSFNEKTEGLDNDLTTSRTDKEILVDGTEDVVDSITNTLTVLPEGVVSVSVNLCNHDMSISPDSKQSDKPIAEEFSSIIEISDDGTWDTAEVPVTDLNNVKSNDAQNISVGNTANDFLTPSMSGLDMKNKHASIVYGAQYYINCPVASIKPMKYAENTANTSELSKNIGAQIMQKYAEERQKLRESRNLPDVSLLDVDESLEDIQRERRKIIESQAVRAKRIDSWIKDGVVVTEGDVQASWADLPDLINEDGEVVYDSILQNKQKTKNYWEQLMLAAELASHSPNAKSDHHHHHHHYHHHHQHAGTSEEKAQSRSDLSEQEFYDAQSHISAVTTPELMEGLDGPKIVETVAKKLLEAVENKLIKQNVCEETTTECEIRIQKEKKYSEDKEKVAQKTKTLKLVPSPTESKIAQEMREMKEREDEWRRQQLALQSTVTATPAAVPAKEEETFNSIPTTDEGNFSEYGSEEKEEQSLDGSNSRMMSPEMPGNQNVASSGFSHHRTQSLDSMSSGHSSGSGSASHTDLAGLSGNRSGRRGITVKPLDEPDDDDLSTFIRNEKETPIEREIRLAREREEELRREKRLPPLKTTTNKQVVAAAVEEKPILDTPKRLATKRIQQEIEQATEREKEFKKEEHVNVIHNGNENNQLHAKPKPEEDLKKGISTLHIAPRATVNDVDADAGSPAAETDANTKSKQNTIQNSVGTVPKKFIPNPGQKGLMKRFLASRGKIGGSSFNFTQSLNRPVYASHKSQTYSTQTLPASVEGLLSYKADRSEPSLVGTRPGYKSAEDKIQVELKEMRKREEELRREQRARLIARSQPDLLSLLNDENESEHIMPVSEERENHDIDDPDRLPTMAKLRTALSNPNLLDVEEKRPVQKNQPKRRSALIAEWEDRIQKINNKEQ